METLNNIFSVLFAEVVNFGKVSFFLSRFTAYASVGQKVAHPKITHLFILQNLISFFYSYLKILYKILYKVFSRRVSIAIFLVCGEPCTVQYVTVRRDFHSENVLNERIVLNIPFA